MILHGKTEASISARRYAQTKFEGTINRRVEDLDAEIKGTQPDMQQLRTSADERTKSVREELDMRIRGVGIDIQVTKTLIETPRRKFRSRVAEVEPQARYGSCGKRVTSADRIKPQMFKGK
jgi:hypothetical protein